MNALFHSTKTARCINLTSDMSHHWSGLTRRGRRKVHQGPGKVVLAWLVALCPTRILIEFPNTDACRILLSILQYICKLTYFCLGLWTFPRAVDPPVLDSQSNPIKSTHLQIISIRPRLCIWAWKRCHGFALSPEYLFPRAVETPVLNDKSIHPSIDKQVPFKHFPD